MAIVSDAWPGLGHLYRRLGLPAHECVIVDDAPDLVAAADLGSLGATAARVRWVAARADKGTLAVVSPLVGAGLAGVVVGKPVVLVVA